MYQKEIQKESGNFALFQDTSPVKKLKEWCLSNGIILEYFVNQEDIVDRLMSIRAKRIESSSLSEDQEDFLDELKMRSNWIETNGLSEGGIYKIQEERLEVEEIGETINEPVFQLPKPESKEIVYEEVSVMQLSVKADSQQSTISLPIEKEKLAFKDKPKMRLSKVRNNHPGFNGFLNSLAKHQKTVIRLFILEALILSLLLIKYLGFSKYFTTPQDIRLTLNLVFLLVIVSVLLSISLLLIQWARGLKKSRTYAEYKAWGISLSLFGCFVFFCYLFVANPLALLWPIGICFVIIFLFTVKSKAFHL